MKSSKWGVFALLLIILCIFFASCGPSAGVQEDCEFETRTFFLKNSRGTYTFGELVMPESETAVPLVFLAHGFKGTRNSGGAKELSERLAEKGIAAVRIDFNSYIGQDLDGEQTDAYTLSDMEDDAVMTIGYVLENYNVDENRIGIHGRSMGGRVAMILANESMGGCDFKAMSLVAPAGNESAMIYYMGGKERWEEMKETAAAQGFCEKQGLKLSYDWFTDFEKYDPSKTGYKFGEKPVLVFYNTLDHVVLPETSRECAAGYENAEVVEVTTEDGHGYEMGFKKSELKDEIMERIVEFFCENLQADNIKK
ncbi:MAG: alpha/beta hydrolase family protein [Emergencia sp.]